MNLRVPLKAGIVGLIERLLISPEVVGFAELIKFFNCDGHLASCCQPLFWEIPLLLVCLLQVQVRYVAL
jgi:hypothetical protein